MFSGGMPDSAISSTKQSWSRLAVNQRGGRTTGKGSCLLKPYLKRLQFIDQDIDFLALRTLLLLLAASQYFYVGPT